MGWSLSYRASADADLVDAALMAAGKALHIANMFESKCRSVLAFANLATIVADDPVLSLTEATALLPGEKMLAGTLRDMSSAAIGMTEEQRVILEAARQARNFIAHEGAAFGRIWTVGRESICQHLEKLRTAVADLAEGDNIISAWIYEIEEKQAAPAHFVAIYPRMVEEWIFEPFQA